MYDSAPNWAKSLLSAQKVVAAFPLLGTRLKPGVVTGLKESRRANKCTTGQKEGEGCDRYGWVVCCSPEEWAHARACTNGCKHPRGCCSHMVKWGERGLRLGRSAPEGKDWDKSEDRGPATQAGLCWHDFLQRNAEPPVNARLPAHVVHHFHHLPVMDQGLQGSTVSLPRKINLTNWRENGGKRGKMGENGETR